MKNLLSKTILLAACAAITCINHGALAQQPVSAMVAPTAPTKAAPSTMPADESAFLAAHKALALQALFADDAAAISRSWNSRAKEALGGGRTVTHWIGKVAEVSAQPDGTYHLVVEATSDGKNKVAFATDAPANAEEKHSISASGNDLAFVAKAAIGQSVGFSGRAAARKDGTLVLLSSGEATATSPVYAFIFTRVVSAEDALREMADQQKQAALKAAREKELQEQASKPAPVDRDKLQVNGYYKVSGVVPLRIALPTTSSDATPLPPPIQILPDTLIFVHSMQLIGDAPWYNVTVDMAVDPSRKRGWINSNELKEKEVYAFDRVALATPVPAIRNETSYNNNDRSDRDVAPSRKPKPGDARQVYILVNSKDELYHAEGCSRLRGQVTKMHVYDADKQDYKPCSLCFNTSGYRN